MIKFSIVIATYNSGKTLRQTLDSIRRQTYENIEVIVIDGMSTDDTIEIVAEYNDTVNKFISEKDTGIYNAFNKGINLATGDYICFIGSDDCYCHYGVFEDISRILDSISEVNILSSPIICVDEENHSEHKMKNKYTKEEIFSGKMLPHPGLMVKRSIMERYGFNETYKIVSDYDFILRYILDGGEISYIDEPIVYFSTGGISSGTEIGSSYWCLHLSERVKMVNNLQLDDYLLRQLQPFLPNPVSELKIKIRNSLGVEKIYRKIKNKKNQHKCKLRICRWCGRN